MCKCGRIRKYGHWKFPDGREKKELFDNFDKLERIEGKCPACRVKVEK